MLVTMKYLLDKAREEHFAIPAPNVDNEHNLRAAIEAAEEMNSPLILGVPYGSNPNIEYFGRIITDFAIRSSVPIAFNLDHGASYQHCVSAIRAGFTSIMVDRSELPYEENVAQVKELVKIAHAVNVSVEAELGHVGSGANYAVDGTSHLTNPEEAVKFVEETGVDCLAVAIGSAHGVYKGEPKLQFERLQELRAKVPVPLVLHGGSGTGEDNLSRAAREGICKVNLSNDLRRAAIEELLKVDLSGNGVYGMYRYLAKGYKEKVKYYMHILGSEGKAPLYK
jgi:fructose-bisphosphate aldolase, class II